MAMITVFAAILNALPGTASARGLPLASAAPSAMRVQLTTPFSMRSGAVRNCIFTPSSIAASTSSALAGISGARGAGKSA